jgi:protein-disulfide isomerase
MRKGKRELILGLGLLILALILVGCGPAADEPAGSGGAEAAGENELLPAAGAGESETESSDGGEPSVGTPGGYQEGFTDEGYPFRGDPAAPVTMEEFSSYQCPFCGRYFRESYPQIVDNYVKTGKVRYVFRDFPLPSQLQSPLAAEAARCAGLTGDSGAYWAMHDRIFEGQREWSGSADADTLFKGYAAELGLDEMTFAGCLDSGSTSDQVQADLREGSARGVNGTPTFFVDGRALSGAQPYAAFARVIDAALSGESLPTPEPPAPAVAPTPAPIAPADDARVLGDPGAPVTIVEFSDYQCPFCARHFEETWPQLRDEYVGTGRVRYVFKDFPIVSIHPEAPKAHEAARCAGEQGAYWAMHERLFAGQADWSGNPEHVVTFKAYAVELELDTGAFDACLDEGRYAGAVNADLAEGRNLGVNATPTLFVDGYPLVGAQPYQVFEMAIDLAEKGTLGDAFRPSQ